jgi:DNA repair protein RadD
LLDFAGNTRRHGPVDAVEIRDKGEMPVKECPRCATIVSAGTAICPDCGHEWPKSEPRGGKRHLSHEGSADLLAPLSTELTWLPVQQIRFSEHRKPDRPPSLRVDFHTSSIRVSEGLAFEHGSGARHFAGRRWRRLGGHQPIPMTTDEALQRRGELHVISEIGVRRDGQYWRVAALRKQKPEAA